MEMVLAAILLLSVFISIVFATKLDRIIEILEKMEGK